MRNATLFLSGTAVHIELTQESGGFSETVKTIVSAILIAIAVRTVAFEPFNIPSKSMVPTLLVGDYLFVSKYSYGYSRNSLPLSLHLFDGRIFSKMPTRGDVVVFKVPLADNEDYIKRVIGLPGDRIQVTHRVLYINGEPVGRRQIDDYVEHDARGGTQHYEQYVETLPNGREHLILQSPGEELPQDNTAEYVVPEHCYFMMGDNRDNSQDSRFPVPVGYVAEENLVGRAEILFFSNDATVAAWWEFWHWPWAVRWERIMNRIG